MQEYVRAKGLKIVVVFEGRDAAGKGGVIKRITERTSPRICRVVALPAPTEREKTQWYFQRYVAHLPAAGEIVLFDRSWYNRAGVERVMGFCTEAEYQEFMRSCPEFEHMLVRSGIQLIKYWFSVSDEEQERRFQARVHDPMRRWKLSPMDLESRARWVAYSRAKDEMFRYTDIKIAPWYVVQADDKRRARLNCIAHLLSMVQYEDLTPPPLELPPRDRGGVHPSADRGADVRARGLLSRICTLAGVPAWFDELSEFLRIESISADPARAADVAQAGEWVCGLIRGAGGECELVDWHGAPLAIGEVRASRDPEHAPTVLCYGHFDVQPPDPLELWESPPFEPEIRGEYLYGRGVADDKGQLYLLLCAARELAQAGELPVNVRFACDGEEESGGHAIVEFLAGRRAWRRRRGDLRQRHDRARPAGVRHRHPRDRLLPRDAPQWRARPALGRVRRRGAQRGACADANARRGRRGRRAPGRAAPSGNRPAERGGARELARASGRRRRARGPGRAARGRARGRGVLPADVRRAGARHQRDRERLTAHPEDRASCARGRERVDPAGAGPAA